MEFYVEEDILKAKGEWPDNIEDALEASIQKWEAILELRPKFAGGGRTCALCRLTMSCDACPVASSSEGCEEDGSPFYNAIHDTHKDGSMKVKHIKAEIEFLKGLRK